MTYHQSRQISAHWRGSLFGCWYRHDHSTHALPQVALKSHTTILLNVSRTVLTQVFVNDNPNSLDEVQYSFPLYDGISVTSFNATIRDRTVTGVVKERNEAKTVYDEAVKQGGTAGLFEQSMEASDIFRTKIGNVPARSKVTIQIIYLGELKVDGETGGTRFTIPTVIAPRYGPLSAETLGAMNQNDVVNERGMQVVVDVVLEDSAYIRGLHSPSHPIAVSIGRTSTQTDDEFSGNRASATLSLGETDLGQDFIIVVQAKEQSEPYAFLETHPDYPNQRALMATLVPKFELPSISPEIVFVVDRSGSMGNKMHLVVEALKVFLKSLPLGVKFNICSFGSHHRLLFPTSRTYGADSLKEAVQHVQTFTANFGGTEMLEPVRRVVAQRFEDLPLEVMVLTDGEINRQQEMFDFVKQASQQNARFFTLGIGSGASSALVEGVARNGNGFAQFVNDGEKIDKRVIRMLKACLMPHINDYRLEVKYASGEGSSAGDDDFDIVESFDESMKLVASESQQTQEDKNPPKKVISLFNKLAEDDATIPPSRRYDHLPNLKVPHVLQAPHKIPSLYPSNRTTVYLLLGPDSCPGRPESVTLKATCEHGELEIKIPVRDIGQSSTIHQLATKKAVQELEEGHGWIDEARTDQGQSLRVTNQGRWDLIVEREAVRLGTRFQVGGKFCSFVAVEKKDSGGESVIDQTPYASSNHQHSPGFGGFASFGSAPQSAPGGLFGTSSTSSTQRGSSAGLFCKASSSTSPGPMFGGAPASSPSSFGAASVSHNGFGQQAAQRNSAFGMASRQGSAPTTFGSAMAAPPSKPAFSFGGVREKKKKSSGGTARFTSARSAGANTDLELDLDLGFSDNTSFSAADDTHSSITADDVDNLSPTSKMHLIIELQSFDGTWTTSTRLLSLLGTTQVVLETRVQRLSTNGDVDTNARLGLNTSDEVKATLAVLAWFEASFSQQQQEAERDVFGMIVDKARASLVRMQIQQADVLVRRLAQDLFSDDVIG